MKKYFLTVAILPLFAVLAVAPAQATDYYSYSGHTYFLTDSALSWLDAEVAAIDVGGHLVTVNDLAEQSWLTGTFTESSLWIGLNRPVGSAENEESFVWTSGQDSVYRNWANDGKGLNEPTYGNETCVAMNEHYAGAWNDLPANYSHRGIVEVVPEPASLVALAGGLVGLFGIRRRKV